LEQPLNKCFAVLMQQILKLMQLFQTRSLQKYKIIKKKFMILEFSLFRTDKCGEESSLITSDMIFRALKEVTEIGYSYKWRRAGW
jgi:hypothetical protein